MDNRKQLLTASFLTLIVAGVGFAVRAGILGDWGAQFGFTKTQLGAITGGGLVGFGLFILVASFLAEYLGYRLLLIVAFVLHFLSVLVTVGAAWAYGDGSAGNGTAYEMLYWGTLIFAIANGICEAVINPLVATLYSEEKTHYLNILHAGWPAGLIIGGVIAYLFASTDAAVFHVSWEILVALYLIPTVVYGAMIIKEEFPLSEARAAGVSYGDMLLEFAAPVFLLLLFLHACIGYVELGTDSWITNIMQNIIQGQAFLLFIYTSALMFVLRFFAGPIVEKINPLGLLCVSSFLGMTGLYLLGSFNTGMAILLSATVYGIGKTFLWPTMLGVVSERFPRGGALTLGAVGAVGMLSAGFLGGPGIGYKQDVFASNWLKEKHSEVYQQVKADGPNRFLFFPEVTGLDGSKVSQIVGMDEANMSETDRSNKAAVEQAGIIGGQTALRWTALVPLTMGLGFLFLLLYFRSQGGYSAVRLSAETEKQRAE